MISVYRTQYQIQPDNVWVSARAIPADIQKGDELTIPGGFRKEPVRNADGEIMYYGDTDNPVEQLVW